MTPGLKIDAIKTPKVSNWSMENGYFSNFGAREYPQRTIDSGQISGLDINLETRRKDVDHLCSGFNQGFKVTLTVPGEAVTMTRNFFRIALSENVHIMIKPKLIYSSRGVRKYTPQQRQCFYSDERKLRFYKAYAQSSCEAECLANFTKIECGCVKFSMPSMNNHIYCFFFHFWNIIHIASKINQFVFRR